MVMSTRRWASSATTCTPLAVEAEKVDVVSSIVAAASPNTAPLRINLSSHHDLLGLVVEGDLLTCPDGGDIHAQCDGMTVSSLNRRIGSFARTDALHPVAHVGRGLWIAMGVGIGRNGLGLLDERKAGEQVWNHSHLSGRAGGQASGRSHRSLVHIDH